MAQTARAAIWDDQFEMRDHRLSASGAGLGLLASLALGDQRRFERVGPVRENVGCDRHGGDSTTVADHCNGLALWGVNLSHPYPAACGRQLCSGWRQSMPSSM